MPSQIRVISPFDPAIRSAAARGCEYSDGAEENQRTKLLEELRSMLVFLSGSEENYEVIIDLACEQLDDKTRRIGSNKEIAARHGVHPGVITRRRQKAQKLIMQLRDDWKKLRELLPRVA